MPVDEPVMENLSSLANLVWTYGTRLLMAEGLDTFLIIAVSLMLILFTAKTVRRKRSVRKSFRVRRTATKKRASGRLSKRQRRAVLKPCPSCAEKLPVSAIICDACGYNFLAERPGRGQALLPSPHPMNHEAPEQKIASAEL
jgi:hypothetical protein